MVTVKLMELIPQQRIKQYHETLLRILWETSRDLNVRVTLLDFHDLNYPILELEGDDADVFKNYLNKTYGLAPFRIDELSSKQTIKTIISGVNTQHNALRFDIGLKEQGWSGLALNKQLDEALKGDGNAPLEQLMEIFCLKEGVPFDVDIVNVDPQTKEVTVEPSREEVKRLENWSLSLLHRLIVVNATRRQIKNTLSAAGLLRFIIDIQRFTFFRHAIPLKLGVNPEPMMKALRKAIPEASVYVFQPMLTMNRFKKKKPDCCF